MQQQIQLTKIEAEVVEHRLQFLADAEDEDIEELFDSEDLHIERLRAFSEATARNLREGNLIIPVSCEEARTALIEAIEGATIHHMALEACDDKRISHQKVQAYSRALTSAAEKITLLTGQPVVVP